MTWLSALVICYSLAVMLQGYVEKKVTIFERIGYLAVIVLAITPYMVNSLLGIALFVVMYGYRELEAKKEKKAAAA